MANYGGRAPPTSAYQKLFNFGSTSTWNYSTTNGDLLLKPINPKATVYITGDLFVGGTINNPSDFNLKDNIEDLSLNTLKIKIARPSYPKLLSKYMAIHDLHEAFIGDIPSPMKKYLPEYIKIEK